MATRQHSNLLAEIYWSNSDSSNRKSTDLYSTSKKRQKTHLVVMHNVQLLAAIIVCLTSLAINHLTKKRTNQILPYAAQQKAKTHRGITLRQVSNTMKFGWYQIITNTVMPFLKSQLIYTRCVTKATVRVKSNTYPEPVFWLLSNVLRPLLHALK